MSDLAAARAKAVYNGLLECPFRSGFVEFKFRKGDSVAELLTTIEQRWGTSYGWATPRGFERDPSSFRDVFGSARGWLLAIEDSSGAYVALQASDPIPVAPPSGSDDITLLPSEDTWYPGAVAHGCYNYEYFDWPRKPFMIPVTRKYKLPKMAVFDVRLIALVAVNGG